MKFTMRIEGGHELARRLALLPKALSAEVKRDALKAGAEPIRATAAELAPYDPRGGDPHLKDNIAIGVVSAQRLESRGRETETVVEVGPELKPDNLFYGFWQEFGTAHHSAQAFLRPAFDAKAPAALGIIKAKLWDALRKALPSGPASRRGGETIASTPVVTFQGLGSRRGARGTGETMGSTPFTGGSRGPSGTGL